MNSLYTDKRNYFNLKLNLLHSHNKELRKQRIQEVENETPKVTFDYTGFDDFVVTFKNKNPNKIYRKNQKNKWNNDGNLRTAFLQINNWQMYYTTENKNTTNVSKKSSKKVVFIN
jgi:hypothetical protein